MRFGFFFLHFGGFGLQLRFRCFERLLFTFEQDHQFQDLVFAAADFLLGEFDFMHQGAILVVGLDARRLLPVFNDLLLEALDIGFMLTPAGFVALDRRFGFLDLGLVFGQAFFYQRDATG